MTNIIGFFGKKGSGKDSVALFIYGAWMHSLGIIKGGYCIKEDGLWITDLYGDDFFKGRFDPRRNNPTIKRFLAENLDPYIKLYSFADDLKSFCINVLGLKWEQCYGSNEEKNSLTHLVWGNMPTIYNGIHGINEKYIDKLNDYMTGREVMQFFGTEIVRRMYSPAWAKSTLRRIKEEEPLLAIITDGRFQDELDEVKAADGKCIKLLRNPYNDKHESENTNIKLESFDAIINNTTLTIDEQNDKLIEIFEKYEGVLPEMRVLG